jgi:hypothetical protein
MFKKLLRSITGRKSLPTYSTTNTENLNFLDQHHESVLHAQKVNNVSNVKWN